MLKLSLFFGAETKNIGEANACVLGLCWDKSSSFRFGSAKAPKVIRRYTTSKLYNPYAESGVNIKEKWRIYDFGDLKPENFLDIEPMVREKIEKLSNVKLFMFLGGDHSITYPIMKALKTVVGGEWGLVYFDSHPDLYEVYEGNLYSHACTVRRIIEDEIVNSKNIVQVGIRASTKEQLEYAKKNGITIISTAEVYKMKAKKVAEGIKRVVSNTDNVYVSFDVDVLDPAYAPGVGNPEGAGITTRQLVDVIHGLEGISIRAFDVVEANPEYDSMHITFYGVVKVVRELLGIVNVK